MAFWNIGKYHDNHLPAKFSSSKIFEKYSVPKKVSTKMKKRVKNRCLMCKYPKNDVLANVWKFRKI